ncbi:MAG: DUF2125 domain-containing protein [Rhizobiaceae bacterium]|nr:DUF2125 domain-containing protein [Rhizobiaceae bacterium]
MKNPPSEKRLMRSRIVIIVLTLFVLIGGGTVGWYYLAGQVDGRMNEQVDRLAAQGKTLECANQQVKGYPFRVGLFCDQLFYEDKSSDFLFKAGELRTAAQFYQPGFIVGELDSPALLQTPGLVDLKLDWKLARTSTRLSVGGIKRISLQLDEIKAIGASGFLKDQPFADLKSLEIHLRPGGDDTGSADVDAVVKSAGIRFGEALRERLPPLSFNIDTVVSQLNTAIKNGEDLGKWARSNGVDVQVRNLEIGLENGGNLKASGPLRVGRDGLVNGDLAVEVNDIGAIVESFTALNPQLGETAKTIQTASMLFAQGSKDGKIRIKIQIRGGIMTMGFFPLGYIPRLF